MKNREFTACIRSKQRVNDSLNRIQYLGVMGLFSLMMIMFSGCSDATDNAEIEKDTDLSSAVETVKQADNRKNGYSQQLSIVSIDEQLYAGQPAIKVTFSEMLDPLISYNAWINISDEKGRKINGGWILSEDEKSLYFTNIRPRKTYEIMVSAGLKGQRPYKLMQSKQEKLTSRNLDPVVGFSGRGMIIPAGKATGLPVRTVNVKKITVDYFKVAPAKFSRLLSDMETASSAGSWRIESITDDLEPVASSVYELDSKLNQAVESKLPLPKKVSQQPAIYFAVLTRSGHFDYDKAITYFTISDIAMHVRIYRDNFQLFTSHISSGKVLKQVDFKVLNQKGELINEARTDDQGEASFPRDKKASLILANKGNHLALISLRGPAIDISEFDMPERGYSKRDFFIYGPRDLYRPGEKMEMSVLLRDFDGKLLPLMPIDFQLLRPDGVIAKSGTLAAGQLGYYHFNYEIPVDASTGKWSFEVHLKGDPEYIKKSILIEDFLPEKIKVSFSKKNKTIIPADEETRIAVQADYLYGAPAAGNKLLSEVRIRPGRTPFSQWKNYRFGIKQKIDRNWYLDDQQLDAKGQAEILLPHHVRETFEKIKGPVQLSYRASVLESGGRAVERALLIYKWKQGIWPGIEAEFNTSKNQLVNKDAHFKIIATDESGKAIDGRLLTITLVNLNRQSYWEYNSSDGWRYAFTEQPYKALQKQLKTTKNAEDILLPVEKGYYRLEVTDESGNSSSYEFRIGENWWSYNADDNSSPRPDKIDITLDKNAYSAGDIAHVKLQSPRPGAGFILVENSEAILWSERLSLSKSSKIVDIPIASNWDRHDLRIVALAAQPEAQAKKGLPMRALGLQSLPLKRTARKLQLSISAPDKVEPQSELKVTLKLAKIPAGKVMVTLAAVDQGVLSVTNFKTPEPWEYFFEDLNPYVDARDNYDSILHINNLDYAKVRYGGDAASLNRGGDKPASEVNIVSLFHEPVEFNASGEAEISLTIPDFNGAIRLMAVAFSEDSYGSSEKNVIVSAPIISQLSMPRFAAFGDETQFTLDLQNTLEQTQKLSLKWNITGARLINKNQQSSKLTLKKNQKSVRVFPLLITQATGQVVITLEVDNRDSSQKIHFKRNWKLGLRPAYAALTEQNLNVLAPGESLAVNKQWLKNTLADTLQMEWVLSERPPLNTEAQWKYLLQYPYGCLEQTTSRAWPLSLANTAIQKKWKLSLPENMQRFDTVNAAIGRLQTMQRSEGGFGLWNSHSTEEKWLTAYVTDYLLSAKSQGFDVPDAMLSRAEDRLLSYVRNNRLQRLKSYYSDPAHFRFAYRAYAAYVLARVAKAPLGTLRQWLNDKTKTTQSPLPFVHLAIALKLQGDNKKSREALARAAKIERTDKSYLGDYGSFIRDEALILMLNQQYHLSIQNADKRLFKLSKAIYSKSYLSTQERDAIFQLALSLDNSDAKWQASLTNGKQVQKIKARGRWSKVIKGQTAAETLLKVAGDRKIYVGQTLVAHPQNPPIAMAEGISIERNWYRANGEKITSKQAAQLKIKTGDYVIVQLRVRSQNRIPNGLLVDLIPAGFELENPALVHSTPLSQFVINGKPLKFVNAAYDFRIKHKEYRDDRLMLAVDFNQHSPLEVFYIMRAVTPGVYQVPSTYAEDMYRPEIRAVSNQKKPVRILPR